MSGGRQLAGAAVGSWNGNPDARSAGMPFHCTKPPSKQHHGRKSKRNDEVNNDQHSTTSLVAELPHQPPDA